MAVSYVGATSGTSVAGTTSSFVTTLPAGWVAGDVAVLTGHVSATSLTMATPAGWTAVPGVMNPTNESTNSRVYAWYRVLQAGDTAPTVTNSGAVTGGWEMAAYRGADTVSPVGQASTATAAATSATLPTLAGVGAGSGLHAFGHARVASGTIPSGLTFNAAYTEVVDVATSRATSNANLRLAGAYRLVASAGSYGGESVSVANSVSSSMVVGLVEVKAAATDATVAPDGVAVAVSAGSPAVDGSLAVSADGVSVPGSVGSPGASWALSAVPDGVSVVAAVGSPAAVWSAVAGAGGLAVPLAVGGPAAEGAAEVVAAPDGVAVPVVVGGPSAVWPSQVAPVGVAASVAVGDPSAGWLAEVAPDGLLLPVGLGVPASSLPGQVVTRPNAGTVARPSTGVVARPDDGVVPRATSTVVRPDAGVVARP